MLASALPLQLDVMAFMALHGVGVGDRPALAVIAHQGLAVLADRALYVAGGLAHRVIALAGTGLAGAGLLGSLTAGRGCGILRQGQSPAAPE